MKYSSLEDTVKQERYDYFGLHNANIQFNSRRTNLPSLLVKALIRWCHFNMSVRSCSFWQLESNLLCIRKYESSEEIFPEKVMK